MAVKGKCNWLHLGQQSEHTIGGTVIASCNVVRDLGIQVDSYLNFMNTLLKLPRKPTDSYQLFDKAMFINLYKTYIWPVLEYGNIMWEPLFVLDQQQVEKVQNKATRLVRDLCDHTYI